VSAQPGGGGGTTAAVTGAQTVPSQIPEQHWRSVAAVHGCPPCRQAQRRFPLAETTKWRVQQRRAQLCFRCVLPC